MSDRIQVRGPSFSKTFADAGAFVKALQAEMDGVKKDIKKDVYQQQYGVGADVARLKAAVLYMYGNLPKTHEQCLFLERIAPTMQNYDDTIGGVNILDYTKPNRMVQVSANLKFKHSKRGDAQRFADDLEKLTNKYRGSLVKERLQDNSSCSTTSKKKPHVFLNVRITEA